MWTSLPRDALNQIPTWARNLNLFFRDINRLYYRAMNRDGYNRAGVDLFDEDWDTLILLDACRYDMFEAESDLPGELEVRYSRGSSTYEFLLANFDQKDLRDTVYVTANPMLHRAPIEADIFEIVNVWDESDKAEEIGAVPPETMTEYTKRAVDRYSNKRIIAHYIQPHYPFLSSETEFDKRHIGNPDVDAMWYRLNRGSLTVSDEEIWEAYVENLRAALPAVRDLLTHLTGRTVVTADHGNMVGERAAPIPVREYGHPGRIYTDELVKIPWLVYERGPRREITTGTTSVEEDIDAERVSDRLAQLGYVNH